MTVVLVRCRITINNGSAPANCIPPSHTVVLATETLQHTPPDQFAGNRPDWSAVKGKIMMSALRSLWRDDRGQDIAEYAVMLAVILVIVVGTIRLVGSNANNVFSSVGSSIQ